MNTITFMTRYKSYTEMQEHLSVRHKQILKILKNKKMTTREIAEELYNRHYTNTADVNNARPRITELENLGFVVTDKTKKCNVTNKEVAVYRQTTEVEKMIKANINHISQIDWKRWFNWNIHSCKVFVDKQLQTTCAHGCNRLELLDFRGVQECKYVKNPREQIKEILGVQEKMKLWVKKNF